MAPRCWVPHYLPVYLSQATAEWQRTFSRHWFGPLKPYFHPLLHAAYEPDSGQSAWDSATAAAARLDLADLAKLYDMLLHQETPPGASPAHRECAATQQLARAAIEAHPRSDEIATLWQQFSHKYQSGYAGYLPSLVSAV